MTYLLQAVVQFVVLIFQSEQKSLQIKVNGNLGQVKLSGAGQWPNFTSAYRNPLFQNTPNFVRHM